MTGIRVYPIFLHATSLSIPTGTFGAITLDGATNSIYNSNPGSPSLVFASNAISTTGTISAGMFTGWLKTDSVNIKYIVPKDSVIVFGDPITLTLPLTGYPARWNYPNGVVLSGSLGNPCAINVGIGSAFNLNSALYISSCSGTSQITAANPTNHVAVFNVDNNGVTVIGSVSSTPNKYTPSNLTGYSLYVAGGILTEHCKVAVSGTTDWSDYVFGKDYKLPTISDMEQYIKVNHHLQDLPSADEVVKNGVDVTKMDALLLKKIEELSLYVIQLQKDNDAMKKEIEKLKK